VQIPARLIGEASTVMTRSQDAVTLVGVGAIYWLAVYPQVGCELTEWRSHAQAIPDPVLRAQALHKLSAERLNPEAAAFFAVLAPRKERRLVVRLIVAYQLLYDYLDAVNELPGCTDLRNGLQLHEALVDAVSPDRSLSDYYLHNPNRRDGDYVVALTTVCRRIVRSLPSMVRLAPVLERAARRCGEAQSRNHAITTEGEHGLIAWSLEQSPGGNGKYLWWELAAGGISCLAIHALFALAAQPQGTSQDAALVDEAYFPPICAISALLDSLADHHSDAGTTNHSFIVRYRDSLHAAERFASIAEDAAVRIGRLGHRRRHLAILRGVVAFYLSSPSVREEFPAPVAENLMLSGGPLTHTMRAVMRLRRHAHGRSEWSKP
jgi:tetraprenyl-beta-curcumene synthase